jgi:hypothetical protein
VLALLAAWQPWQVQADAYFFVLLRMKSDLSGSTAAVLEKSNLRAGPNRLDVVPADGDGPAQDALCNPDRGAILQLAVCRDRPSLQIDSATPGRCWHGQCSWVQACKPLRHQLE